MNNLTDKAKEKLKELTGSDHFPDPHWVNAWAFSHGKLECKVCHKPMKGNGTVDNPWVHKEFSDGQQSTCSFE